ncbi:MAG: hypothetical protein H0U03_03810 [Actinobacteria bacterium]|nr:hypothetical protein [Actinomycetota bacterium]
MALLPMFSTPGRIEDTDAEAWSAVVSQFFGTAAGFPQFYDPTVVDTPPEAEVASVIWSAFPASLRGGPLERMELADAARGAQDEYCEWTVEKNADEKITRVTFTTEVPEYFDHLFTTHPDGLLAVYRNLIDERAEPADLEENGAYLRRNKWNNSTIGRPAHLVSPSNNLFAAVQLAAQATVLRERDGQPVTNRQDLVACARLGEPLRNSDPQIASAVNNAAANGDEVTLADPIGLYIDGLMTGGMEAQDGEDPGSFWKIERGDEAHTLRAAYEVPPEEDRGYVVGDITIDGRRIVFGGQLAIRVRVRLDAVVKPGDHQPDPLPCVGS